TIYGEIDIIAEKENIIVFFEVKYRKTIKNGYPREAVSKAKQDKIKKTALIYISENNIINKDFSFDVIEILGNEISHIKNAFF
ncbi:MAG: YraN family protein, partial [Eubacteriales bacterium]|nr:YraN family protein [Eubacteriales bacterium]